MLKKIGSFLKQYGKWIGGGLLVVLVIMQFFPIDKQNPSIDSLNTFESIEQPPQEIALIMKKACNDCHSNTTEYPWYTNIAPVSWWVKGHIDHGREELNFSEWGTYSVRKKLHKMEEVAEEVEATKMPLLTYALVHTEAFISKEERASLVKWFADKAKAGEAESEEVESRREEAPSSESQEETPAN